MREYHYNTIDNLTRRLENKIQKKIEESIKQKNDIDDRTTEKMRAGLTRFGAFQLFNPHNADFAIWGSPGPPVVGA